jgi:integrase
MARTTPSLQVALDDYVQTRVHLSRNTLINDTSVLNRFVRGIGPTIQVGHVTPKMVESWFGDLHRGQQASSYNKVRARVRGFVDFCVVRGWTRQPLLANVRPRRVVRRERLQLTATQLLALLDAARNPRDRGMLAIGINLGLRASEITSIRLRDLDLAAGTIHVTISKTATEDTAQVNNDLDSELRRWLAVYYRDTPRPLQGNDYLFPTRFGPRLLRMHATDDVASRPGGWRPEVPVTKPARIVQGALREIGLEIGPGEGFHTLRRSAGRVLFDHAAAEGHEHPLRTASAYLHHSGSQVTEQYLSLRPEKLRLDELMRGKPFLTKIAKRDATRVVPIRRRSDSDPA